VTKPHRLVALKAVANSGDSIVQEPSFVRKADQMPMRLIRGNLRRDAPWTLQ
jgi:hypothetical protein